jgi:parallel beta-helix repeat protein
MKRKALTLTLVMAVLVSTLGIEFVGIAVADPYIPPEEAPPGYRINSDGTYTAENLRRDGNVYTFIGDIQGTIVIERDGVVLDGAGYTLQGNGSSYGIWLQDRNNVTIKNLNIRNCGHGIRFSHYAPDWHSGQINPIYTTNCTIQACNITNNGYGITFYSCLNCSVLGNYMANNTYGIKFYGSGNTFRNNRIDGNQYNFWELDDGESDVDTSNTVDGKPIYYWVNQHNMTVPDDAGTVILKRCSGIRVQNLNLTRNGNGITLYYTNNSRISGNNISDNYRRGIAVWWSNNNSIIGNQIANNTGDGIEEYESESNTISHNLIKTNKGSGISQRYLVSNDVISSNQIIGNQAAGISGGSNNCTITDNYVFENAASGISVNSNCVVARNNITSNGPKTSAYQGSGLIFRSNCTITDNHISKNNRGIWTYDGEGSIIAGNMVAYNNNEGIRFQGPAENNLIYRNNFIENNNGAQATVNDPAPNAWDNGIEGNYWSDYKSTPYFINDKNQDNHPLIAPIEFAPLELPSVQPPQEAKPTPEPQPEPFPTTLVATASAVLVAIIGVGLLVYLKKRNH